MAEGWAREPYELILTKESEWGRITIGVIASVDSICYARALAYDRIVTKRKQEPRTIYSVDIWDMRLVHKKKKRAVVGTVGLYDGQIVWFVEEGIRVLTPDGELGKWLKKW